MGGHHMIRKSDFIYMYILWLTWFTADYYKDLFQLNPGDNPSKSHDQLMKYDDYRVIRVYFPKNSDELRKMSMHDIKDITNDYFQHVLLPRQKILKPFSVGDSYYDITESLYVLDVFEDSSEMAFDVLYIDNDQAYKIKRYDEQSEFLKMV